MSHGGGSLKSRPWDAIRSAIDSPNWVGNVLWLTLAVLLGSVFVGQIALFGYGSELIRRRAGLPGSPTVDVNSERIGDYVSAGIWPFLVQFVLQIAIGMIVVIPAFILVMLGMGLGAAAFGEEGAGVGLFFMMPIIILLSLCASIASIPFVINAMVCQDFQNAFDFGWAMGFLKIMFTEILISGVVFMLLSMCVGIIGMLMLCVGYLPALGIINGGAMNMLAQWYEIYLDRGGVPAQPPAGSVVEATII